MYRATSFPGLLQVHVVLRGLERVHPLPLSLRRGRRNKAREHGMRSLAVTSMDQVCREAALRLEHSGL